MKIKYNEMGDKPKRGQVRVMFLGGSMDHLIRPVEADHHHRPIDEVRPSNYVWAEHAQHERYHLHRIAGYPVPWWVYVLAGHKPSRIDLVDANPGVFHRGMAA